MKSLRSPLIAVALLAGLSGLTLAQNTTPPAHENRGVHSEKMHAKMGERHNKHMAELKTKLKLASGQEAAWNTFTQAMQMPTQRPAHPDRAALEKMTTPERIDQMQAHKAQRDAEMQKRAEATKAFYAVLDADQKKTFDAETARMMKKMTHDGRGHHGHH